MKTLFIFLFLTIVAFAQTQPAMYFCEDYSGGEVGVGCTFSPGTITVMVRCDHNIGISNATIQFDRWENGNWNFYKQFSFMINKDGNYFFFKRNDLVIQTPGFYRCYLLNKSRQVISSAIVEIVK
jgi:hypothetical protein